MLTNTHTHTPNQSAIKGQQRQKKRNAHRDNKLLKYYPSVLMGDLRVRENASSIECGK